MPRGSDGTTEAAGGRRADRLGGLPDELLQHTLSFLPSREAVRTSLLARRWRHQCKSVPVLRVTDANAFRSAQQVNDFINYLMIFRDRTTLRECEIAAYKEYDDEEEYYDSDGDCCEHSRYTDLWIRYALSCNARLLRLSNHDPNDLYNELEEPTRRVLLAIPIFSRHLMTLELDGMLLSSSCSYYLDFSSCPNLETLKMNRCSFQILGDGRINISSPSVRCLSITACDFSHIDKARALISVPSLVYLELTDDCGLVPAFESMPKVLTASIKFDHISSRDDMGRSLLLRRLSDCTNLELIAKPQAFASRQILKRCTRFRKLKTLSINDWSVEPNCDPLLHFLRLSPSLEKLCLRISKYGRHAKKTEGIYDSTEPFLASKHLDVQIRCRAKDKRVHKILKVLSSYGIPLEQINVKEKNWSADGSDSDFYLSDYSHTGTEQSD